MRPREIQLRIEEIVLEGLDPGDRNVFSDAVVAEVERGLMDDNVLGNLSQSGGAQARDAVNLPADHDATWLGSLVGRSALRMPRR